MLVPLQGATAGTAVAVAGLFEWCVRLGWSWAAGVFGGAAEKGCVNIFYYQGSMLA